MTIGRFMCGIAALIYHPPTQTYLIVRRSAQRDFGADNWECVTGRVDQGESFQDAVHREVREETTAQVRIEFVIGTSHFYRGEQTPENELLVLRYACTIEDRDSVVIGDEHSEMRWLTAEETLDLIPESDWLHETVRSAETIRSQLSPELADFYRGLWVK